MPPGTSLTVMKVLAGRGKDLDDLRSRLASGDVGVAEARDHPRRLEKALGRSDPLPDSEEAVLAVDGGGWV